ncbi:hypothetical protein PR003_g25624 [Phytophthora rubi]|uniref:Uncharacterized protein n=1 Tax=Phytophthora rubi TaxID=129364 RepID=A0A6A3IXE2_9STRA|nr:hypothetical protein PR002_g22261 [Phytophthora rubi]KAE9289187.1 hypothetical protein PR003_g25624 [Phytophthora rubi]
MPVLCSIIVEVSSKAKDEVALSIPNAAKSRICPTLVFTATALSVQLLSA